jgi:hypothetical protein
VYLCMELQFNVPRLLPQLLLDKRRANSKLNPASCFTSNLGIIHSLQSGIVASILVVPIVAETRASTTTATDIASQQASYARAVRRDSHVPKTCTATPSLSMR